LARQRCKTLAEFQTIEGIGAARTEKYGKALLEVIRDSASGEPEKEEKG